MVASLACLSWPLRMCPMHIGKAHWLRVGHIHHKSLGRNPQNELQSPLEGFDINPQPLGSSNFTSSSPNHFCVFLPTTRISNSLLFGRATLASFEQADEEAGMCVKEEKEQQTDESTVSHFWLLSKCS